MADLDGSEASQFIKITGGDEIHTVDVITEGGLNKLVTTATISSVNVPQGQDPLPDAFFTITNAGAIGDTVRVQIAATSNDSSSPDRDLPAVDVTTTVTASEVGDEVALAELIISDLKDDSDFNTALLDAERPKGDTRAIVHISSDEFSLNGEFAERPNTGDVAVSVTGTTTVIIDTINQKLISRSKPNSLARDPNNPHRLGIIGISGSVRVSASEVEQLFSEFALDGASNQIAVNGSVTPVEFIVSADAAGGMVKVIEIFRLYGDDGNIKVGEGNFLGDNSALANGLLIEITKDTVTTTFRNLKSTNDILGRFSSSTSNNKIIVQSGGSYFESVFDFVSRNVQIRLDPGTTDEIKITVRDDLSSRSDIFFVIDGFLEEE